MDDQQKDKRTHFRRIVPRLTADGYSNDQALVTPAQTTVPRRNIITRVNNPTTRRNIVTRASNPTNRRHIVTQACNPCRERKRKCDAKEPECTPCMSRGNSCSYSIGNPTLQQWKEKYEQLRQESLDCQRSRDKLQQLVHHIRYRSEAEASRITQQLRDGINVETVLRHIETGDVLLQLHLEPESKYRYSIPFGSDIPRYLQKSDNPYLQSILYSTGSPSIGAQQHDGNHINDRENPQYFKPYHAATILDPKLDSVKPSVWTTVSNDDKLMRSLLHDYFLHEYEWLSFFHKDHFLDDMLSGAKNFCSSLLVNSVLAVSYHCSTTSQRRSKFWDTRTLGGRFFEEAKRLWELEKSVKPSLPTLQAALVMGNLLNMCSLDKIGRTYNVQALTMANELGLFKPLAQQTSPRRRDSYTFTAWSLFFSNCVQDYHTLRPPLCANCPFEPLPDPVEDPAWYGSFWMVYPLTDAPLLVQHGPLFKAKLELAMIMNSISIAFFGKEEAELDKPTRLRLALMFTQKLTAWYSSLPVHLSPTRIVFSSQLKLHLLYHNVMTHMSRVLTEASDDTTGDFVAAADTLLANSNLCFETLMRLYYLRHGFEGCDAYMTHTLAVLAFTTLTRLKSPASSLSTMEKEDIRGTLILSAKGLNDQGQNYHLPRVVFHLLHSSMMAEDEAITSRITSVRLDDETEDDLRKEYIQAQYPINITNITESPEDRRLSNIIEKIDN